MRQSAVKNIVLLILISAGTLMGWGYETHRRINRAAAMAATGEFGDFISQYIEVLAYNGANPDFWKSTDQAEEHRHYFDADLYDNYPFDNIPRNIDSLYSKYGVESVSVWGIAPYNIEKYCDKITELLKAGETDKAVYSMSALGHYVADIHMPLHTVANYNGQFTGNEGVHFRWESPMVDRYVSSIQSNGEMQYFADPIEMAFTIVGESYLVHKRLFSADSVARAPLTKIQADSLNTYEPLTFEDQYLSVLYRESSDVVQERLNSSATRVLSYWYSCWINSESGRVREGE